LTNRVNVLIFPAGSESAMDIYDSLKYNLHFNVFGASGKTDHASFIYPKGKSLVSDLYITNESFIEEFNKVLDKFKIDFVIPTYDTIAVFLTKHRSEIHAKIVCSPYETAKIAGNKNLTYEALKNYPLLNKVYLNTNEVIKYPVFLKPYVGAGGAGTYLAENKEDLESILNKNPNLLICEYLSGKEYTVDCFTNKNGELLFAGARTRERIAIGKAFHSERVKDNTPFANIARMLNSKFKFRGAWFFQVKEDENGQLKLMEFAVRQAGTMTFHRQLGVNFAALSLFDAMGYDVKVLFNDYEITLDRRLKERYHFDYKYEKVYVDFDDTIIVNDQVNTILMKFIYQCVNEGKQIILLTKHAFDLNESFQKHRICKELFDEIILIKSDRKKSDYINSSCSIFIDNYFFDRLSVKEKHNIPVFDVDAVECLIK
jgi:hypothetical protein